eukprot:GDKK01022405.1.p1 GENE.GDKK01022405.1~~GDKK01022405.1.p1  ORF type:complete len:695 (-),score=85.59 GDKK01022405.1:159-2243(-)
MWAGQHYNYSTRGLPHNTATATTPYYFPKGQSNVVGDSAAIGGATQFLGLGTRGGVAVVTRNAPLYNPSSSSSDNMSLKKNPPHLQTASAAVGFQTSVTRTMPLANSPLPFDDSSILLSQSSGGRYYNYQHFQHQPQSFNTNSQRQLSANWPSSMHQSYHHPHQQRPHNSHQPPQPQAVDEGLQIHPPTAVITSATTNTNSPHQLMVSKLLKSPGTTTAASSASDLFHPSVLQGSVDRQDAKQTQSAIPKQLGATLVAKLSPTLKKDIPAAIATTTVTKATHLDPSTSTIALSSAAPKTTAKRKQNIPEIQMPLVKEPLKYVPPFCQPEEAFLLMKTELLFCRQGTGKRKQEKKWRGAAIEQGVAVDDNRPPAPPTSPAPPLSRPETCLQESRRAAGWYNEMKLGSDTKQERKTAEKKSSAAGGNAQCKATVAPTDSEPVTHGPYAMSWLLNSLGGEEEEWNSIYVGASPLKKLTASAADKKNNNNDASLSALDGTHHRVISQYFALGPQQSLALPPIDLRELLDPLRKAFARNASDSDEDSGSDDEDEDADTPDNSDPAKTETSLAAADALLKEVIASGALILMSSASIYTSLPPASFLEDQQEKAKKDCEMSKKMLLAQKMGKINDHFVNQYPSLMVLFPQQLPVKLLAALAKLLKRKTYCRRRRLRQRERKVELVQQKKRTQKQEQGLSEP